MKSQDIIGRVNAYLHEVSVELVNWLNIVLPRVTKTWWKDCVIDNLSSNQIAIAESKGFTKLSDFDLSALLRITDRSWYGISNVYYLKNSQRETVRKMFGVRNNWAHCSTELPGKDAILSDLFVIKDMIEQLSADKDICADIERLIQVIERPDSLDEEKSHSVVIDNDKKASNNDSEIISQGDTVYLTALPEKRGMVTKIESLGGMMKYMVFIDGSIKSYYGDQVKKVKETGVEWKSVAYVRSKLTAYQINNPSSGNLYSLNSARIDFVPYQFRPALKLIHSDEPRILIADSVGVGKTIEAGLIIKELEARYDLERIAIICPRPLVAERKWELEMQRFDEEFIPLDGKMLRQIISDTQRDGEWPSRFNKVIIPYSILDSKTYLGSEQTRNISFGLENLAPKPHFDLIIVDEAHHIRNGNMRKEKAFEYKCTKYFCDNADAVVMLTATPLQTNDNDLYTLLNVLRPDVIIDQKSFEMMSKPNQYISRALRYIRSENLDWTINALEELKNVTKTQWGDNVISKTPVYSDIIKLLERGSLTREERVKLITDVESLHSFGNMINRTRRCDIQDFCVRKSYTISTYFTEYQKKLYDELLAFEIAALSKLHSARSIPFMISSIKRQAASCIFGLAPYINDLIARRLQQFSDENSSYDDEYQLEEESLSALTSLASSVVELAENLPKEDPKFDSLLNIIRQNQENDNDKIMIFSTYRYTLRYIEDKLSDLGFRVAQVNGDVDDEQRYNYKLRFELPKEDEKSIDIMLFTEVGSEGLDYQFCHTMINYDLPWNPMRIEQRIGRIDRRGQKSEVVNIYNMITENTVDAEIYNRCLLRIGVFESHIGDCDVILGEMAKTIDNIMFDSNLTDEDRKKKLDQIADNEVRRIQEINRLEEEEKEFFGFDLTEFTTSQEIKKAETPWLTPNSLQQLIENYLNERVAKKTYITGESTLKNIKLSYDARETLRTDLVRVSSNKNAAKQMWDSYLRGKRPDQAITFDPDTAEKNRNSLFITSTHPLAKQAANFFDAGDASNIKIEYYSNSFPEGEYLFSVYAWRYTGFTPSTRVVIVSEEENLSNELPFILEELSDSSAGCGGSYDWSSLEEKHIHMWSLERDSFKQSTKGIADVRKEVLKSSFARLRRVLEQRINDSTDSIQRMYSGQLENEKDKFEGKINRIRDIESKADILTTLLVNGVITIKKE